MKISLSVAIFLLAVSVFITYQITYNTLENKLSETAYTLTQEKSSYTKLNAVDDIVRATYIHDIDEEKLEDGLIIGYLYGIEDKYATYLTAEEFENYKNEKSETRVGLGVSILYDSSIGGIYVSSVSEDSPAMEAGIREGDIIYAVDGETIDDRGYYDTVNYITSGKEGEPVTVVVKKGPDYTEYVEYKINRSIIKNTSIEYEMYGESTGYVKISSFDETTPKEFKAAMQTLSDSGATGYIFDVRSNLGGELDSVSSILDYLLPEGPIIRIQSKADGEEVINSDAACIDAPMAVLVNESTASAAELFASALRDYKKALLIGKTTYGKGTVQTMHRLSPEIGGGALSISTGMYKPPKSENYEGVGITPDIEVEIPEEMRDEFYKVPLEGDPQFIAALETITPQSIPAE